MNSQQEFFRDKAHGRKMIRVAWWIVSNGKPMSGLSVLDALAALGIDGIDPRNEREVHGIVAYLRECLGEGVRPAMPRSEVSHETDAVRVR